MDLSTFKDLLKEHDLELSGNKKDEFGICYRCCINRFLMTACPIGAECRGFTGANTYIVCVGQEKASNVLNFVEAILGVINLEAIHE